MEWTREKTLALISEYRKRRGLWDMTHDDYRKKDMKQKLLMEVSASLGGGIPIVEIEKKFHTLRTQYHREINRMKRKEPYNSKWFGFKYLQFLSSPKACRSVKGRIKSEITEEGTVTRKYIIRESAMTPHDTSGGSANSSNNISDEFITLHRKPNNTYEAVSTSSPNVAAVASRSHELEKLIEETTKDVEDIEEAKPKMPVTLEHHTYSTQLHTANGDELQGNEQDPLHAAAETHHQHHHHQQQVQHMDDDEEPIESIEIQPAEEEIAYQSSSSTGGGGGGGGGAHSQSATAGHHSAVPTRIIKIQRRETCHDEDFYDDEPQQHHQQSSQHHVHTLAGATSKRIYYEADGQQHTAILASPATTAQLNNSGGSLLNPAVKAHQQRNSISSVSQQQQQHNNSRDEYATYGEYVANEMRGIINREVLVALKHKINTALFEAHMAELQK